MSKVVIKQDDPEELNGGKDEDSPEFEMSTGSFGERLKDVFINMGPLGIIAFGGPPGHFGVLFKVFVEKKHWLTSQRFVELLAVCQALPGPTSTHMVVAIGALRAGIPGGFLAFLMWNFPNFTILVAVGLTAVQRLEDGIPDYFSGLPAAATAVVFTSTYTLGMKVLTHADKGVQRLKILIATMSVLTVLLVTGEDSINPRWGSFAFPIILLLGGITTLIDSRREGQLNHYWTEPTLEEEAANKHFLANINHMGKKTGVLLFSIMLSILISVVSLRAAGVFEENSLAALFEIFFRIGSIVYGGGQVILPMLLEEVVNPGYITEAEFFLGFSLVSSLPGPLFNFSSFIGAIYAGFLGAIVCWFGLFGPGFLLILAFLPFWASIRRASWIKCALAGVNAAAIGLLIAACAQLWERAVSSWADAAAFFVSASALVNGIFVPFAILLGGFVGFILSPTVADFGQNF